MIGARRALGVLTLLLVAGALLWSSVVSPRQDPLERRAMDVAASLRCPTCAGESAADSAAAPARAMRAIIRDRLAAGEDPDQVRGYFEQRYGSWVLLDPPPSAAGHVLRLAPWAAGAVGLLVVVRVVRGRPRDTSPAVGTRASRRTRRPAAAGFAVAGVAVALLAAAGLPGTGAPPGVQTQVAASTDVRRPGAAPTPAAVARRDQELDLHRAAARARPDDAAAAFRLGFALVKAEQHAEAERVLSALVERHPGHREALLLLGTAERALGRERWRSTLRAFLEQAPDHVAAPAVRRLVEEAS